MNYIHDMMKIESIEEQLKKRDGIRLWGVNVVLDEANKNIEILMNYVLKKYNLNVFDSKCKSKDNLLIVELCKHYEDEFFLRMGSKL